MRPISGVSRTTGRSRTAVLVILVSLVVLVGMPALADDRLLFQESTADPYVFILLDLSGSMNQSVPCTHEAMQAGECTGYRTDVLYADVPCGEADLSVTGRCEPCPPGACLPRLIGDDPESKLRVAKESIHALMEEVEDVHFGFATFDQDRLRVWRKHWWYRVADAQPDGFIQLRSGRAFPPAGQEDVFGKTWACNRALGDAGGHNEALRHVGCRPQDPADLDDRWEYERVRRLPKLGDDNNRTTNIFIRDDSDGAVYAVQFNAIGSVGSGPSRRVQSLGDPVVDVEVQVACHTGCNPFPPVRKTIRYEKAAENISWEPGEGVRTTPPGEAFFGSGEFNSSEGSGGTRMARHFGNPGWDPNTDSSEDDFEGQNLRYPNDGPAGDPLTVGDVVPWDWNDRRRDSIRHRMAPNSALSDFDPTVDTPDFQIATYFEDHPSGGREALRLRSAYSAAGIAPLVSRGGTPTGAAMEDFHAWLGDWAAVAESPDGDPEVSCREKYLLVLTDGLASSSDGSTACDAASALLADDVRSFAIAFGLPETELSGFTNTLTCIANNGGTGTRTVAGEEVVEGPGPLFPQNKEELVEALLRVIQLVRPDPRTLTGVAVPSVQAEASDKLFLTDFTPLNGAGVWPGHLYSFAKPLPLDENGRPDLTRSCADLPPEEDPSACFFYDVNQVMLDEQVRPSAGAPVGERGDQRRVYRSLFDDSDTVPKDRLYWQPPTDETPLLEKLDLYSALGLDPTDPETQTQAAAVIASSLAEKNVTLADGSELDYILGDIFHSDPLLIGPPSNNLYFLSNVGRDQAEECGDGNRGYRCFALEHARRRRVLFAGSNDGMLHAFDVGAFEPDEASLPLGGTIDAGSGRELFAYVPRPVSSTLVEIHENRDHHYTVDGRVAAADVFIDPAHARRLGDPPNPDERIWRTLLVGGLRRGGGFYDDLSLPPLPPSAPADSESRRLLEEQPVSGYYALDVTSPDPVAEDDLEPAVPTGRQPGCAGDAGGGALASECGPQAYGMPRWEFTDSFSGIAADENGDGFVDLAPTWSRPALGRIRICSADCGTEDPVLDDRYVAIFGGGLDPERPRRGQWLYIVDVEDGQPIYKQPVNGAVASAPAAVDTDFDGYLDRIYVGTVEGYLYRVDLRILGVDGPIYPQLEPLAAPLVFASREVDGDGNSLVELSHRPNRIIDPRFEPVVLFDAGGDDGVRRPIFFPPSVIYVPQLSRYAVAFGTGDREDLFSLSEPSGRFFTFVDDVQDLSILGSPLSPDSFLEIGRDDAFDENASQVLVEQPEGTRGWWLELDEDERLVTAPFALAGVLVFSTYHPQGTTQVGNDVPLCEERGTSRVFGLVTTTGQGIMATGSGRSRYIEVDDFVTAPFTEQAQTKNPPPGDSEAGETADRLNEELASVMRDLRRLFPPRCSFQDGYRVDIKARSSDTGMLFIAPVPVCIIEKDFREW